MKWCGGVDSLADADVGGAWDAEKRREKGFAFRRRLPTQPSSPTKYGMRHAIKGVVDHTARFPGRGFEEESFRGCTRGRSGYRMD